MNLKSFLTKLFLGQEILEKVISPINGEITVVEDIFGRRKVLVGGLTQSGGLVEKLWRKAISNLPAGRQGKQLAIRNCLILGLGCGSIARLITDHCPLFTKITGVEIDPVMIEIGRKYFRLDEIKNLEIVIGDAIEKVKSQKSKFNLIIVDLYLGKEFPKGAESEEFLNGLRDILAKDGLVIFNRLYYDKDQREKADKFLEKIRQFFPQVEIRRAITNLLIYASSEAEKRYN